MYEGRGGVPAVVNNLDDGAQGTIGQDAQRAAIDVVEHHGLCAVPSAQRSQSEGGTYPQHVVAVARGFLQAVRIELRVVQLESLVVLAVDVNRLPVVEIDAVGHEAVFECRTVMVQLPVGVGASLYGQATDVKVLLVFLLDFLVRQEHLRIDLRLVGAGSALAEQLYGECAALLCLQVSQEKQLVEASVAVEIVQLAGNLLSVERDKG